MSLFCKNQVQKPSEGDYAGLPLFSVAFTLCSSYNLFFLSVTPYSMVSGLLIEFLDSGVGFLTGLNALFWLWAKDF